MQKLPLKYTNILKEKRVTPPTKTLPICQQVKIKIGSTLQQYFPETFQTRAYIGIGGYKIGKMPLSKRIPEKIHFTFGKKIISYIENEIPDTLKEKVISCLYRIKSLNPSFSFDTHLLRLLHETIEVNPSFSIAHLSIPKAEVTINRLSNLFLFFSKYIDSGITPQEFHLLSGSNRFLSEIEYTPNFFHPENGQIEIWRNFYKLLGKNSEVCINLIGPPSASYKILKSYIEMGGEIGYFEKINTLQYTATRSKKVTDALIDLQLKTQELTLRDTFEQGDYEEMQKILSSFVNTLTLHQDPNFLQTLHKNTLIENYTHITGENEYSAFNPSIVLKQIRRLPKQEQKEALEKWRQKYKFQLEVLARIPENVILYSQISVYGLPTQLDIISRTLAGLKSEFALLSIEQKKQAIDAITQYIKKIFSVHRVINSAAFYRKPKTLLASVFGITEEKIVGKIEMENRNGMIIFLVDSEKDYHLLYTLGDDMKSTKLSSNSLGFTPSWTEIPELSGAVSVIKHRKKGDSEDIKIHETSHMLFHFLRQDTESATDPLVRAKDEILAYLKDGTNIESVQQHLIGYAKTGVYDYFQNILQQDKKRYKLLHRLYAYEVSVAIETARIFQSEKIQNYQELLTIVPIRSWGWLAQVFQVGIYSTDEYTRKEAEKSLNAIKKKRIQDSFFADIEHLFHQEKSKKLSIFYQKNILRKDINKS